MSKVAVHLSGFATVQIEQYFEMEKDRFEELQGMLESDDPDENDEANEIIKQEFVNVNDITDIHDFNLHDFVLTNPNFVR